MRRFILIFLVAVLTFSFSMMNAEAKRFGGGKSFGASRSASSFSRPNNVAHSQPAVAPKNNSMSKWLGPLAGLALGGLFASLLMGHGLASGMLSWLMVAGVIFLAWRLLTRGKLQPATSPIHQANFQAQPSSNNVHTAPSYSRSLDFDETDFLRQVKALFIRLQAAYDNKNLNDIREFTAPEVFAEIQLQLQERGDEINYTDVININAELLDYTPEAQGVMTSVLFSGLIREQQNATPNNVKEIWHFRQDNSKSTWVVAGIQQEA